MEGRRIGIGDTAQAVGGVVLVLYLLGFIATSIHLAKWGFYSLELLNVQYLAAGSIAATAFAIFAFVVGRRIYHSTDDFTEFARLGYDLGWPKTWPAFCLVFVLVEIAFGVIAATLWTSILFFEDVKGHPKLIAIVTGTFVLDYLLSRGGLYRNRPYFALPMKSSIFVTVIVAASGSVMHDTRVSRLFGFYVAMGFVLSFVLDAGIKIRPRAPWTWFWALISVLSMTVVFGSMVYGDVKRSIGGGRPVLVRVVMTAGAPQSITALLNPKDGVTEPLALVAETPSELLLLLGSQAGGQHPLRIRRDLVAAIIPVARSQ